MSGPSRQNPRPRPLFRAQETGMQRRPDTAPAASDPAGEDAVAADEYDPSLPAPASEGGGTDFIAEETEPAENGKLALPIGGPQLVPGSDDDVLPAFRLRNVYEGPAPSRRGLIAIYIGMGSILLLAIGGVLGYLSNSHGADARRVAAPSFVLLPGKAVVPEPLSVKMQADIDAAFDATKQHRYQEAQKQFAALHDAHPEWPSMAIESARATLYAADTSTTLKVLSALTRNGPLPDAEFITALMHMTHHEYDQADRSFASAVALDPARPDFFYFWGECLRAEGKPQEAIGKFQAALVRNQYETAQDLYQMKLWLSEIQADKEVTGGANAKIDAALALPRPPYSAVFAAAARQIKASHFKEAGTLIAQGQQLTDPVVFRVLIQDPTFSQENWRPEMAGFYKQESAPAQ